MQRKIPFWRSFQFKYACVLLLAIVLLTAAGIAVVNNRHHAALTVYEDRKFERQTTFDVIADLNSQSLKGVTIENTYWDDMVHFIQKPTADFETNILRAQLESYGADAAWTYNPAYKLVSNTNTFTGVNSGLTLNLTPQKIDAMFAKNFYTHYYTKTSVGLLEVFGATVHDSSDVAHKTPSEGYYFIARVLDGAYTNKLSKDTRDRVAVIDVAKHPTKAAEPSPTSGAIAFYNDLHDADGTTVGRFYVTYEAKAIALLFQSLNQVITLSIIGFSILAIAICVALEMIIVRPLRIIYRALSTDQTTYLNALIRKQNEFGRIAELISSASQHKAEVFKASEQTRLAQVALESRTKELERINGLMVNRELQMIDLKKQISELKVQSKP